MRRIFEILRNIYVNFFQRTKLTVETANRTETVSVDLRVFRIIAI